MAIRKGLSSGGWTLEQKRDLKLGMSELIWETREDGHRAKLLGWCSPAAEKTSFSTRLWPRLNEIESRGIKHIRSHEQAGQSKSATTSPQSREPKKKTEPPAGLEVQNLIHEGKIYCKEGYLASWHQALNTKSRLEPRRRRGKIEMRRLLRQPGWPI
jgi:hypothetical protein